MQQYHFGPGTGPGFGCGGLGTAQDDGGSGAPCAGGGHTGGCRSGDGGKSAGRHRGRRQQKRFTFPYINSQIIQVAEAGDLAKLITTIENYLEQMNLVNVSTAMHRLAKLTSASPQSQSCLRQHPVLAGLLATARSALARAEGSGSPPQCQALSNITWSMATISLVDLELLRKAAYLSHRHVHSFKPYELSSALWAYAKLDSLSREACEGATPFFQASASHILEHVEDFSFRCLVMSAWAFATARHHSERLFRGIAAQILCPSSTASAASSSVQTAQCQELANAAWAFATAGIREERLFHELAKKALRHLVDFKGQELSNIMWAFAANGFIREDFFVASAQAVLGMELTPQQLSNVTWSLSRTRPRHRASVIAMSALLPRCTAAIADFKPQELASVALAAAKCFGQGSGTEPMELHADDVEPSETLPREVFDFFSTVLSWVVNRLPYFSGQSLANIVTSILAVQPSLGGQVAAYNFYGAVGSEVRRCLAGPDAARLETGALLLLIRNLPAAPRPACGKAVCMLVEEAYRRINIMTPREMQVLSKICVSLLGLPRARTLEPHEVASICLRLSKEEAWGAVQPLRGGLAEGCGAAGGCGGGGGTAAGCCGGGCSGIPVFQAPIGLPLGAPPGGCQGHSNGCSLSAPAAAAGAAPKALSRAPATGGDSPSRDLGERIAYSVKKTFVDFESNQRRPSDPDLMTVPLPPPLKCIPSDVELDKLEEYRLNYQRFRAGDASGAKGELSKVTASDSEQPHAYLDLAAIGGRGPARQKTLAGDGEARGQGDRGSEDYRRVDLRRDNEHSSPAASRSPESQTTSQREAKRKVVITEDNLPPPLDFMPKYIDLDKLATFRVEYQNFRAGHAAGAKGEIREATQPVEAMSLDDQAWLLKLAPPLSMIPESVSSKKLAAYRVSYQKFRAGEASGAKGEVSTAVLTANQHGLSPRGVRFGGASSAKSDATDASPASTQVQPPRSISVKNTFVHITASDLDDGVLEFTLPPPLPIIPPEVSLELLEAYRTDYQKFRSGGASGAKGEVSNLTALDLADGSARQPE